MDMLDLRRRMMGELKLTVTLDFSGEGDYGVSSETYIEYMGVQYRKGEFKCKKGETIKCYCTSVAPRAPVSIYVDGIVKQSSIGSALWEHTVESDILIIAGSYSLKITTE